MIRCVVLLSVALLAGCSTSSAPPSDRDDSDAVVDCKTNNDAGAPTVIDISLFTAKSREAGSSSRADAGSEQATRSVQSPSVGRSDDHDSGVPSGPGFGDEPRAADDTADSTEGHLCVFGPSVIGVEFDGECAFPPIGSYALTCGDQYCEQDWCNTEYRHPDGRLMVMGSLYCSDTGCACRCRAGYGCVRDDVVYCDIRSC